MSDYQIALYDIEHMTGEKFKNVHGETIYKALRIADRLQRGDVSMAMLHEGYDVMKDDKSPSLKQAYKAMTEQLLKECESKKDGQDG